MLSLELPINSEKKENEKTNLNINLKKLNMKRLRNARNKKGLLSGRSTGSTNSKRKDGKIKSVVNKCNEVYKNKIYVSDYIYVLDNLNIEKNKITHIINAAGYECKNIFEDIYQYKTYYLNDDIYDDIYFVLLDSFYFIKTILKQNDDNKILIHCNKGISRSIIIIIFFLMNELNIDYFNAFKMVKKKRKLANPNMNLITQLLNMFNQKKEIITFVQYQINKLDKDKEENKENYEIYYNFNIFRIDAINGHITSTYIKRITNKTNTNTIIILDKRFNYIFTINFKEYFLLLFQEAFEEKYISLYNHFVFISNNFFNPICENTNKSIIRKNILEFLQNYIINVKVFDTVSELDQHYLSLQNFLKT
ncbi:protein tyrosine phosphatase [Plasmodium berghei]|uniref:Protein tyrosine phosphatase n=3 Tax=Plasmodium berghei TaxID=5821 RepID=A0A509AUH4_PLABA|nr:protein tyrosine phosphatase [Plasmodium berghei ANKA]CXI78288.1 protein tyrosine phosphatase [Plasmodium berghei]SCM25159.1 protein tyrosine phosphatase [Plasmodium berghei]SCN27281.1 protein tyrosine phosphatase [Plasmodium berghei]SCO61889.1 protein tyrosine phosphatase [Plasmodium berghei]VUC57138.1 protein tyrosine phosphatase [Plasmodium berghei ANKA]|eukprot:XP_034422917.1 protein tyrosine phosphatase [Plasmodium berghei ANKA]